MNHLSFDFSWETALQLLLSFVIGTVIGLEREYRSKAAGLRTMIVICLGSTIFTEISMVIGNGSPDRIASNIITGIGFLGAGVIFKDGLTISGITTATTIWISAALGMAVGAGQYFIALTGSIALMIVLIAFEGLQQVVSRMHQARAYKLTCNPNIDFCERFEAKLKALSLKYRKDRDMKQENSRVLLYDVYGSEKKLDQINAYLRHEPDVKAYEY